jgi:hypothetical protein
LPIPKTKRNWKKKINGTSNSVHPRGILKKTIKTSIIKKFRQKSITFENTEEVGKICRGRAIFVINEALPTTLVVAEVIALAVKSQGTRPAKRYIE